MAEKKRESGNADVLPAKVAVMKPILRFLQLLCENHNPDLQVISISLFPMYIEIRNRKWLNVNIKKKPIKTHRLYISKLFGKGYYIIAISDMYLSRTNNTSH